MQNQSRQTNYQDKPLIQEAKVNRIVPSQKNRSGSVYFHPQHFESARYKEYKEKENETLAHEHTHSKNDCIHKNSGKAFGIQSLLSSIFDFLKTDDGFLILILFLLIIEDSGDDILILAIAYIFISGNNQFQELINRFKFLF